MSSPVARTAGRGLRPRHDADRHPSRASPRRWPRWRRRPGVDARRRGADAAGSDRRSTSCSRRTTRPSEIAGPSATGSGRATPTHAIAPTPALPGAHEALAAVRRHGGRSVVVTGKYTPNAALHVEHLGLDVDAPRRRGVGRRQGRRCCAEHGAIDLRRRPRPRRRGRPGGGRAERLGAHRRLHRARSCVDAGTDVVLDDLTEFPAWLDEHLLDAAAGRARGAAARRWARCWSPSAAARTARSCSPPRCARSGRERVGRRHGVLRLAAAGERDPARDFADVARACGCSPRTPTRWTARATAPTPATAATSARPSCSTCSRRSPREHGLAARRDRHQRRRRRSPASGPGIRAAAERGAVTPLRDAGLTKEQIRAASRALGAAHLGQAGGGLPVQPRIAYGIEVTPGPAGPGRARRGRRCARRSPRPASTVRDLRVRDLGDRASARGRRRPASTRSRRLPRRCSTRVRAAGFDAGRGRPAGLPVRLDERAAAPARPMIGRPDSQPRRPAACAVPRTAGAADVTDRQKRFDRAHRQGQVVRRREGLRLPLQGRGRRRLRALRRAARGVTTLKPGTRVEFGLVQGRKGDQALQVRVLDPAASVAEVGLAAHRKKPEDMVNIVEDLIPAARGRRAGLPRRPPPRRQDRQADRQAAARAGRRARALSRPSAGVAAAGVGRPAEHPAPSSATRIAAATPRPSLRRPAAARCR